MLDAFEAPLWTNAAKMRARALPYLLLGAAIGTFLYTARRVPPQVDDALIYFRYARNLIEGNGLVFNVGERVEGFTSLSWVLLLAAGMACGASPFVVTHVLSVASSVLMMYFTYAYADTGLEESDRWVAGIAPWLLLATSSFGYWSTAGLETPMYAAAVIAALVASARSRPQWATGAVIIATLTRPEGVLIAALVLASHVYRCGFRRLRTWLWPSVYAAFLLALTAFRLGYYGALLPNTFYAKVGSVPFYWTLPYIIVFGIQILAPLAWPTVFAIVRVPLLRLGAAWLIIVVLYVLAVGADYFVFSRFFLPAIPPLAALGVRGALASTRTGGFERLWGGAVSSKIAVACIPATLVWYLWGAVPGLTAIVVCAVIALLWRVKSASARWVTAACLATAVTGTAAHIAKLRVPYLTNRVALQIANICNFDRNRDIQRERKGEIALNAVGRPIILYLKKHKPPVRQVAAVGIGLLSWETRITIIDLVGLVDATIAHSVHNDPTLVQMPGHQRSNAAYVLSRKPEYILIPRVNEGVPVPAVKDLWDNPDLDKYYRWDDRLLLYRRRRHPLPDSTPSK